MRKLYNSKQIEETLENYRDWIETLSRRYGIPAACIRAVLWKEMTEMDLLDIAADLVVQAYWLGLRFLGKRDSSTGYAQIFGYVGINAINFALDRGLADCETLGISGDHRLRPEHPDDLRLIWTRLHREPKFNLELATLNLLSAAEEMTGRIDFSGYSAEELKLIFTRYNANVSHITAYGEAVYQRMLELSEDRPVS